MIEILQTKRVKKVVIAIDKFKGSLSATQAAESVKSGLLKNGGENHFSVVSIPLADGGEGSLDVMERALEGSDEVFKRVFVETVDPIGREIKAPFLLVGAQGKTAFIEMAQVSGFQLIKANERDILRSSTYGLGEMIRYAINQYEVTKIVLAIGGSATNDGGFGLLTALGFRYKNGSTFRNNNVPTFLENVQEINDFSVKEVCPNLFNVEFEVACDVVNPLLGQSGATMVYGGQKGGSASDLLSLEKGLTNWAKVVQEWAEKNNCKNCKLAEGGVLSNFPGTGAAGGVAFPLFSMLGAKLLPGWELFSQMLHLEREIASADLVITGEGMFDIQSLAGKLPFGVAQICKKYNKPLILVCGVNMLNKSQYSDLCIDRVIAIKDYEPDRIRSFTFAAEILEEIVSRVIGMGSK